ncbi:hypothetical protein [Vibrio cholerae]|uniref:hypothetical protein n=1 Tax=Vibrio cholerae TaxID=666 RepID=UPI003080EF1F
MAIVKSYFIENVSPSVGVEFEFTDTHALPNHNKRVYPVFETHVDKKIVYVAWCGGALKDGELMLTSLGQVAADALAAIPNGSNEQLIVQELKDGATPTKSKVRKALKRVPRNGKIMFVGDMQNSLDGQMFPCLNIKGTKSI